MASINGLRMIEGLDYSGYIFILESEYLHLSCLGELSLIPKPRKYNSNFLYLEMNSPRKIYSPTLKIGDEEIQLYGESPEAN